MLDSDQQLEIEGPEELLADMPPPSEATLSLLMLTAAYVASEIVLPMIFVVMLKIG